MAQFQVVDRRGGIKQGSPILLGAPRLVRNSSSAVKDSVFVYWVSPKGEIQPAADSRITEGQLQRWPEYRHWRRCEATGPKEIEKVSVIISRQLWEKKKQMKVQQHIREKFELDQLAFRAKLRIAQGFSKNDEEMNRRILQRAQQNEANLLKLIISEFDPTTRTTALDMEVRPQSTSRLAMVGQKATGI
jgi:hypothetical protein